MSIFDQFSELLKKEYGVEIKKQAQRPPRARYNFPKIQTTIDQRRQKVEGTYQRAKDKAAGLGELPRREALASARKIYREGNRRIDQFRKKHTAGFAPASREYLANLPARTEADGEQRRLARPQSELNRRPRSSEKVRFFTYEGRQTQVAAGHLRRLIDLAEGSSIGDNFSLADAKAFMRHGRTQALQALKEGERIGVMKKTGPNQWTRISDPRRLNFR